MATNMDIAQVVSDKSVTQATSVSKESVTIHWTGPEEQKATFHSSWLKYNCQCSNCKQVDSGQRISDTYNFLPKYTIKEAYIEGDALKVKWNEENEHIGSFPLVFLRLNSYDDDGREKARDARKLSYLTGGAVPQVKYEDVMNSDEGLLQWLRHLNDSGLCLVKGLPFKKGAVKEVAERIWAVLETIYGDMFDVVSKPTEGTINIAYTSMGLGYHMDLPYYESPPGIQFLHCLQLDPCVTGGENQFLDTFYVSEQLRERFAEDFATLTRVPATFQKIHYKRENPVSMTYQKPHIAVNASGDIIGFNWGPCHEGPLRVPPADVEPYYKAYQKLSTMLRESEAKVEYRMEQGDMISFNNRRMVHARSGFELNGGIRHLQGCYVNIDEFRSRFEVLNKLYGDGKLSKRVGNNDLQ